MRKLQSKRISGASLSLTCRIGRRLDSGLAPGMGVQESPTGLPLGHISGFASSWALGHELTQPQSTYPQLLWPLLS